MASASAMSASMLTRDADGDQLPRAGGRTGGLDLDQVFPRRQAREQQLDLCFDRLKSATRLLSVLG